jgi:hypothetical protein
MQRVIRAWIRASGRGSNAGGGYPCGNDLGNDQGVRRAAFKGALTPFLPGNRFLAPTALCVDSRDSQASGLQPARRNSWKSCIEPTLK